MPSTREELDQYLNRQYKGKPWRRVTTEEIVAMGDKDLLERIEELNKIEKSRAAQKAAILARIDGGDDDPILPNEVKADEQRSFYGPNGDIPDNISEEQMDAFIADERKRIYWTVTSPPRNGKYLDVFKRKYPKISPDKIKSGFFLIKDGIETPEYAQVKERQEKSHVRARLLSKEEQAEREVLYGKENKAPLAYASIDATRMIQEHVYAQSDGVDMESVQMAVEKRGGGSIVAKRPAIDVIPEGTPSDKELFEPEEDLLHPVTYAEMPVGALHGEQKDKLKTSELERGVPPKVEK